MKYKISSVIQWTVKRRMIEACLAGVGNTVRGHAEKNMIELCWDDEARTWYKGITNNNAPEFRLIG